MKKRKIVLNCFVIFAIAILALCCVNLPVKAMAQTMSLNLKAEHKNLVAEQELTPPTNLGVVVANDQSGIKDEFLYQYLLSKYNTYYNLTGENRVYQVYTNMFQDFTTLDFTEQSVAYGQIRSLSGLRYLNLENLKVLNLARQQISEVSGDDLKNLLSIEEIVLCDNKLKSFTLPNGLTALKKLNLNKNYLTQIDISLINEGEVYLSFNRFESINNIELPRVIFSTDLYVELFNNNILDGSNVYNMESVAGGKISVELGLQGVGLNYKVNDEDKEVSSIAKSSNIVFYNSTKYPNMQVKIYNNLAQNEVVKTISNNSEQSITNYNLGVGEYKLVYVDGEGNEMYNYKDDYACAFKSVDQFKVVPTAPVVKFIIKNKEYDNYGKFNGVGKLVATNVDGEGDIYYSFGDNVWVKGNEVELKRGGRYSVSFKCVIGELDATNSYESEVVSKLVQQSVNPYVPDGIMLILVVGVGLLLFFVVLPLIIKYTTKR